MVSSGEYAFSIAQDRKGLIVEGSSGEGSWENDRMFWSLFVHQGNHIKMAEALLDDCMEKIAKTEAIGLFCQYSTPYIPEGYYESLGQ